MRDLAGSFHFCFMWVDFIFHKAAHGGDDHLLFFAETKLHRVSSGTAGCVGKNSRRADLAHHAKIDNFVQKMENLPANRQIFLSSPMIHLAHRSEGRNAPIHLRKIHAIL